MNVEHVLNLSPALLLMTYKLRAANRLFITVIEAQILHAKVVL